MWTTHLNKISEERAVRSVAKVVKKLNDAFGQHQKQSNTLQLVKNELVSLGLSNEIEKIYNEASLRVDKIWE